MSIISEKKQTVSSTAYIRSGESSIRMALMLDKLTEEGRDETLAAMQLLTQAILLFEQDERLGNKLVSTANRLFSLARTKKREPKKPENSDEDQK